MLKAYDTKDILSIISANSSQLAEGVLFETSSETERADERLVSNAEVITEHLFLFDLMKDPYELIHEFRWRTFFSEV